MAAHQPQQRFSDRVADYIRHRPSYPDGVLTCLRSEFGLTAGQTVADVGSGTGISAALLLDAGLTVYAVEPNAAMRSAAETALADRGARFISVAGSAEATTLPDACVDWVLAAQAFHWFDPVAAAREFRRILRDPPRAILLWNNRREDTPFLAAFEALLHEFAIDYAQVKHQNTETDGRLERFFAPGFILRRFENLQRLDFAGLAGRLRSSSYMPQAGHPRYDDMIANLRRLFDAHVANDTVDVLYDTRMYVGYVGGG